MKCSLGILISASLLVISVRGNMMELFEAEMEKCATETGVDISKLIKVMQGAELEVEDNMKCFGACVLKTFGVMSEDGVINKDVAINLVPDDFPQRDVIVAAMEDCYHGEGDDHCATAWNVGECLKSNHVDMMDSFS